MRKQKGRKVVHKKFLSKTISPDLLFTLLFQRNACKPKSVIVKTVDGNIINNGSSFTLFLLRLAICYDYSFSTTFFVLVY